MDFLAKKAFHPGTFRNQEKVWLKEQERKAEEERIKEWQTQIDEERKREELQKIYTGSAHGKNARQSTGLEWMYSAPIQQQATEKDYLMGKKFEEDKPDLREELNKTGLEAAASKPVVDEWARSHNDPMLAMKMHEKAALDALANNPLKMARLKEALGIKDEKKHKKHKKEKSKKKKKERSRSRSADAKDRRSKKDRSRSRSRSAEHKKKKKSERSRSRSTEGKHKKKKERSRSRSQSPHKRERRRDKARSNAPEHQEVKKELVVPAGYGLQFPGGKQPPPTLVAVKQEPDAAAEPTKAGAAIAPGAGAAAHKRRQPIKLTEEEKAERLRQMSADASVVDRQRAARVATATQVEHQEEQELTARAEQATFVRDMNRKVFIEGDANLGERLQSVRHTTARSATREDV